MFTYRRPSLVKMLLVYFLALTGLFCLSQGCEISMDCNDGEGRSLCFEKSCQKDVPCNKDNDCFFYGAADVSHNYPHPKCFKNPKANSPPGYGICMLREYAGGLQRIPGDDVVDNKATRAAKVDLYLADLKRKRNIFKLFKHDS